VSEVYQWQGIWRYWNGGAGSIGGPGGATVRRGTANVAGTSYPGSLIANDGTEANFTSFQCKAVRGLVGVTHGSSEPTGLLGFDNEGNYVAQVGASRTHTPVSMRADLDPADGLSLHALIGSTDGTAGGTTNAMVLARPQVLCDAPA